MPTSVLRDEVTDAARAFAWGQWGQLGLLADAPRRDRWAIDPEALLLFSLELGRDDPRLFDELLDWLLTNDRLVSVQRLRNLANGDEAGALVNAALDWVSGHRPRQRLASKPSRTGKRTADAEPLFRGARTSATNADETFLRHGFVRGKVEPSGKSRKPDLGVAPAFAFRLRQMLGLGARAEVVRFLLTVDAPRVTAGVVSEAAGYAKRNVHEALTSLAAAGVIDVVIVGNEQRYGIDKAKWAGLLDLDGSGLPEHRDWPQLLRATARLIRWLQDQQHDGLSEYMLASEARLLLDELRRDLTYAGLAVPRHRADTADHWKQLTTWIAELLAALAGR